MVANSRDDEWRPRTVVSRPALLHTARRNIAWTVHRELREAFLRVSVADDDEVGGMQGYMSPSLGLFDHLWRNPAESKVARDVVTDGTARGILVRDERGFVTEIEADYVIYAGIAYDLENYVSEN